VKCTVYPCRQCLSETKGTGRTIPLVSIISHVVFYKTCQLTYMIAQSLDSIRHGAFTSQNVKGSQKPMIATAHRRVGMSSTTQRKFRISERDNGCE
jgi:hypothetical protein